MASQWPSLSLWAQTPPVAPAPAQFASRADGRPRLAKWSGVGGIRGSSARCRRLLGARPINRSAPFCVAAEASRRSSERLIRSSGDGGVVARASQQVAWASANESARRASKRTEQEEQGPLVAVGRVFGRFVCLSLFALFARLASHLRPPLAGPSNKWPAGRSSLEKQLASCKVAPGRRGGRAAWSRPLVELEPAQGSRRPVVRRASPGSPDWQQVDGPLQAPSPPLVAGHQTQLSRLFLSAPSRVRLQLLSGRKIAPRGATFAEGHHLLPAASHRRRKRPTLPAASTMRFRSESVGRRSRRGPGSRPRWGSRPEPLRGEISADSSEGSDRLKCHRRDLQLGRRHLLQRARSGWREIVAAHWEIFRDLLAT